MQCILPNVIHFLLLLIDIATFKGANTRSVRKVSIVQMYYLLYSLQPATDLLSLLYDYILIIEDRG